MTSGTPTSTETRLKEESPDGRSDHPAMNTLGAKNYRGTWTAMRIVLRYLMGLPSAVAGWYFQPFAALVTMPS